MCYTIIGSIVKRGGKCVFELLKVLVTESGLFLGLFMFLFGGLTYGQ